MNNYIRSDILITKEELDNLPLKAQIHVKCNYCNNIFTRTKRDILNDSIRKNIQIFCSRKCKGQKDSLNGSLHDICQQCGKSIRKTKLQYTKVNNHFCSQSCSAIFYNANKTYGYKRSKLEIWIESKIKTLYPNIDIKFNDNKTLGFELDIFIPSLKLAFELNGIFHYEPIYPEKFEKTQNRDKQKMIECYKQNIELCVINTTKQHTFSEKSSFIYLDIIKYIINQKIERLSIGSREEDPTLTGF